MKKRFQWCIWLGVFVLSFTCLGTAFVQGAWAEEECAVMHPDLETLQQWIYDYETAPEAYIDEEINLKLMAAADGDVGAIGPVPLLLDHLTYTPSERNQGSCGNCWVWAGTGIMEINHSYELGVKDRLSIQYLDSCKTGWACCGGNLTGFAEWYNTTVNRALPWSNSNAQFQDGARRCEDGSSLRSCATISKAPDHDIGTVQANTIPTTGVSQATAIANIKNVLHQHRGIFYGFFLADNADWTAFRNFWNGQPETAIWNPDPYNGHTWVTNQGGGHGVLIVGYNTDDANSANHYWIVVNSWGTASGGRPNGIYRLKMNINYGGTINTGSGTMYTQQFMTLDGGGPSTYPLGSVFDNDNRQYMIIKGGDNQLYYRSRRYNGSYGWNTWNTLGGSSSHQPAVTVFNTRLYTFVKAQTGSGIYYKSMNSSGTWSGWSTLSGGTSASPAVVVFGNRLYVFVRGGDGGIWYRSMSTSGSWDAWSMVPGSTLDTPCVAVWDDKLALFVTGGDNRIYIKEMSKQGAWSAWGVFGSGSTDAAPSATVFNNRLYLFVKGGGSGIYYLYKPTGSALGIWNGWYSVTGSTDRSPNISLGPRTNEMWLAVKGAGSQGLYYRYLDSSTSTWNSWTAAVGGTPDTPSLGVYWFDPYNPSVPEVETDTVVGGSDAELETLSADMGVETVEVIEVSDQ